MAAKIQCPPSLLLLLFLFSTFMIPPSSSQSAPQNIEVFYPFLPLPLPPPPRPPPPASLPPPPPTDTTTTPPPNPVTTSPPSNSSNKTVAKAVGVTAASTLVLSGLLFLLLVKYKRHRKENKNPRVNNGNETGNTGNAVLMLNDRFTRVEGIKGVIVDEEGLDVLYWKNLDDDDDSGDKNAIFNNKERPARVDLGGRKSKKFDVPIQEAPLLDEESSGSQVYQQSLMTSQWSSRTLPPTPPPPPQAVAENMNIVPLPPPPPRVVGEQKSNLSPPPPPPRPQVVGGQKSNLPPPPPPLLPKTAVLTSSTEPPQQKVQLKPLHWDKVNANVGHPTAWDKMDNGSFRFDGDFMEAMFGTVAANKKSPRHDNSSSPTIKQKSGPPSKIFILDTRKSQNIAIILRSLNVSRQEIIDCLLEGKGLDLETLEKLTKIHPTKEEEQQILNYDQDTTKLADAESFLYHILKPVPSAFTRFNAMFFRLSYTSEVTEIKNTLQTLETACKELRTRGLFVKLLEAVLKAGNRMNVGTSRGNAQAFNMNSLLKLSDVKSSDGKTTLLHFVVEEVVRLEGKRCMINNNSSNNNQSFNFKDYIRLGLPTVGGVSSEFTNVKKAAAFDYDTILRSCSGLTDRLDEIKKTVKECGGDGDQRGFVREMERFVERAEREIQILRGDQERVIGLVKKINEYYQAGASKDKGRKLFQLFVIVKGFLEMVDKACIDIAVKLQKERYAGGDEAMTSAVPNRPTMKFPVLPPDFISSSSSDSEDTDDDYDDDGL